MDVNSLHYEFKLKMDRVDSLSQQDFNVAEIDWLLNEAQLVFVKRRYSGLSNPKQRGFENTQKRIDDLSTLVIKYPEQPPLTATLLDTGVYEVVLADTVAPYLFLVDAYTDLNVDADCIIRGVPLKFIQHDDIRRTLKDPFNEPSLEFIPYNIGRSSSGSGSSIYVYGGKLPASYINSVYIEYVKYPSRISFGGYQYINGVTYSTATSELPEQTHSELVDIACELAALNIENPEYIQLKQLKVATHE
jgi:hypothetical protein